LLDVADVGVVGELGELMVVYMDSCMKDDRVIQKYWYVRRFPFPKIIKELLESCLQIKVLEHERNGNRRLKLMKKRNVQECTQPGAFVNKNVPRQDWDVKEYLKLCVRFG